MNTAIIRELGQQRRIVFWKDLSANDVGEPFSILRGTPWSVQITGTLDGARVAIQGTNDVSDNQRFIPLMDGSGVSMVFGTECIEAISVQCMAIRPQIFGGSPRTKINVYIFVTE
jgi:hypothetical protein